jgi:hypothetical protein
LKRFDASLIDSDPDFDLDHSNLDILGVIAKLKLSPKSVIMRINSGALVQNIGTLQYLHALALLKKLSRLLFMPFMYYD